MNETDPLTDQDKINLWSWYQAFQTRNQPLLDDPWTPDFGHYPPNLDFTDPEDPAGQGGPHWDGTQTAFDIQEPPTAAQEGFRAAMIRLWHNRGFWAFLGVMALFLVMLAVYGN